LLLLAAWLPTSATTLIELQELPDLVEESRRAVLAEVVNVRYGLDEHGLHSTWVGVRVDDALYGDAVQILFFDLNQSIASLSGVQDHAPITCGTGLEHQYIPTPSGGNRFWLVAPLIPGTEGSQGTGSSTPRDPVSTCAPVSPGTCPP